MEKTFRKKERLAIYKRLLVEVDEEVKSSWKSDKYLCWKLLIKIIGLKQFQKLTSIDDEHVILVKVKFPEFTLELGDRHSLNTFQRIELLNRCIRRCETKVELVELKDLESWLGSDQANTDNLKQMLLEIVNGTYKVEELRNDILSYE
jgi:hypothetical protein